MPQAITLLYWRGVKTDFVTSSHGMSISLGIESFFFGSIWMTGLRLMLKPKLRKVNKAVQFQPNGHYIFFSSCWSTSDHIGRSTRSTQATLEQFPIQVLTKLNVVWLQWSYENWYFQVDKPLRPWALYLEWAIIALACLLNYHQLDRNK